MKIKTYYNIQNRLYNVAKANFIFLFVNAFLIVIYVCSGACSIKKIYKKKQHANASTI